MHAIANRTEYVISKGTREVEKYDIEFGKMMHAANATENARLKFVDEECSQRNLVAITPSAHTSDLIIPITTHD